MTTTAIKWHPILFSGPMVRAILAGRKTMTRRVVKPQPWEVMPPRAGEPKWPYGFRFDNGSTTSGDPFPMSCPYGKSGDRLYVREKWQECDDEYGSPCIVYAADLQARHIGRTEERGDHLVGFEPITFDEEPPAWRPSIFMPRWASRISLEVKDVRVERVQEITEEDAIAEGIRRLHSGKWGTDGSSLVGDTAVDAFRLLWDELNASRGHPWENNDWVWVVEFKRIEANS